MAVELGSAYVTIYPKCSGFGNALNKTMNAAGISSAKTFGSSMKSGLSATGVAIGNLIASGVQKAAGTITASVGDAISRYDTLSNFSNVMSNLGIATEDAETARNKLAKGLEGLPTTLQDGVSAVQRFTSANGDIDKSTDMFLALNNAVLAGGGSAQVQASAMEQLSQAYARGSMDMVEWRSINTAMPAQLKQIASAMGMTTDKLGEGLRGGTISMEDFMEQMMELNENGSDGMASLADQAKTATGGISTNITLCKTRVVAGMANIMDTIDQELANSGLPKIGEAIGNVANGISDGFKDINKWIKTLNIGELIAEWQPAFDGIKDFVTSATPYVKTIIEALIKGSPYLAKLGGWLAQTAAGIIKNKGAIAGVAGALGALKLAKTIGLLPSLGSMFTVLGTKIQAPKTKLAKLGKEAEAAGKKAKKGSKGLKSLAKGGTSLIKIGAGIAIVAASFWLMANAATQLAAAGPAAIAVFAGMVLAIGGFIVLVSQMGSKMALAGNSMILFGAGLAIVAASFAILTACAILLANSGVAAIAMFAAMVVVIGALLIIVATFGAGLTAAIPGLLVFGAVIAAIALSFTALTLAITLLVATISAAIVATAPSIIAIMRQAGETICNIITTVGNTIQGIIESIGQVIVDIVTSIGDSVSKVVDSISGGITDIIQTSCDGISKIVETIGDAVSKVVDSLSNFVTAVANLGYALPYFAEYGGSAAGGILKFGAALASLSFGDDEIAAMEKLSGSIRTIAGTGKMAAQGLLNCQTVAKSVPVTFSKAANVVVKACKKIQSSINHMKLKIPKVEVGELPKLTFKAGKTKDNNKVTLTSKVDWYAKGGIFDSASLVGVGEAGSEAVLPLNKKTLGAIGDGIANSSDNRQQNVVINLNYSADADANQMVMDIARGLRRLNLAGA